MVAAQAVLILPAVYNMKPVGLRCVFLLIAVVVAGYLLFSKCRAAWLGLTAGLLLLVYIKGSLRHSKVKMALFTGFIATTAVLVFGFKTGSSNGRMLIYKVIAGEMPTRKWLTGLGGGRFKTVYNQWQAQYFTRHDINSREALLADNTYYVFNDYLQFFIEYGFGGLLCILAALLLYYYLLQRVRNSKMQNPLIAGTLASVAVIAVAAVFSYPLQNGWVQVYILLCLLFVAVHFIYFKWLRCTACGAVALIIVVIGKQQFRQQYQDRLNTKAVLYSRTGYKQKALQLLENAACNGSTDGNTLFLLAKEYFYSGKPDSALFWLQRAGGKISNLETSTLFAKIYEEKQQYAMAEQYYLTTVYMVPNRFESRYNLVLFYKEQHKDSLSARWTSLTRSLPVKIPSEKVNSILNKLKN